MFLRILIFFAVMLDARPLLAQSMFGRGYEPVSPIFAASRYLLPYRLSITIGAAVLGLCLGAFFSPFFAPFRRLIFIIVLVLLALLALFGPFDGLAELLAAIVFVLAYVVGRQLGLILKAPEPEPPPTSFGSACWATYGYLNDTPMLGEGSNAGGAFFLGAFAEGNRRAPLVYSGKRHLLTVAPTRSGKGIAAIIPNLLSYTGSVFVIDPKGENALITAARRGSGGPSSPGLGQEVSLIDPWDVAASALKMKPARFNPLDWIKLDDPDAAENAFLLADALVPGGAEGEARFWDDEAKALLTGIILYVATAPSESKHRHLGRVRDILLLGENELRDVFTSMFNHPLPVVASTASRTASKDPKLRANVMAAVQSHTHFLDSPRIRESLSATDVRFDQLKTRKMSVYLILPADRLKTFDRWLRLLIQHAITVNARNITAKPTQPVLFMLDEMPSLGRLTMVEQAYGLMAGFGMQLWGIVQDLSQLHAIYRDGWQTFVSNSGVIQYFGSRDKMTAEYFSSLCGVTTVRTFNIATAINRAISLAKHYSSALTGGGSESSGTTESRGQSITHSYNESQRQLAYPDELMVLKGDEQILFIENLDPIRAEKVLWFEDENLKGLGVNLEPNAAQRLQPALRRPAERPVQASQPGAGDLVAPAFRSFLLAMAAFGWAMAGMIGRFKIKVDWTLRLARIVVFGAIASVLAVPVLAYALLQPNAWALMLGQPVEPPPPSVMTDMARLGVSDLRRSATVIGDRVVVNRDPVASMRVDTPNGLVDNLIGYFDKGTALDVDGVAAGRESDVWFHVKFRNGGGFIRGDALKVR